MGFIRNRVVNWLAKIAGSPDAEDITPKEPIEYYLKEIAEQKANAPVVPKPTTQDSGKLLSVDAYGNYELVEERPIPELPNPLPEDANKAIKVNSEGAYTLGKVDGFVINVSNDEISGDPVVNPADWTGAKEAVERKAPIYIKMKNLLLANVVVTREESELYICEQPNGTVSVMFSHPNGEEATSMVIVEDPEGTTEYIHLSENGGVYSVDDSVELLATAMTKEHAVVVINGAFYDVTFRAESFAGGEFRCITFESDVSGTSIKTISVHYDTDNNTKSASVNTFTLT